MVTFNGSCWNTCQQFLIEGAGDALVVAAQELRLDGERLDHARTWAVRNGWQPFISPCRRLESKLPSAGVGIFVRAHVATTMVSAAGGVTGDFEIMRSWAVAVHVHAGLPGGFIVGSAYMESVNEGDFNTANIQKLMRIAECMRYFSAPFLFAGDWNAEPNQLEESGWMQVMPAAAITPTGSGTCRSATTGTYRTIDYWLTSPDFVKACSNPRVLDEWTPRPHYPVRVDVADKPRVHQQIHLRSPKPFPKQAPRYSGAHLLHGPPPLQPYIEEVQKDAAMGRPEGAVDAQKRLDDIHAAFISYAEQDLCKIYQLEETDKYCGRAEKPSYVWSPVGGPPLK